MPWTRKTSAASESRRYPAFGRYLRPIPENTSVRKLPLLHGVSADKHARSRCRESYLPAYCGIADSTTVNLSESPATLRISRNSSSMPSVTSCGSSTVASSESTEMFSWST